MKVICPRCGNLIEISKKDDVCFCSECGSNFSKEQGIDAINKKYKYLQNLAYKNAYDKMDYEAAINAYKESLTLKSNDFTSIVGIALCKLYGQKFDNLAFKEIKTILDSYDITLNNENTFIYLNFLKDVLKEVDVFYSEANSRLIENGLFKCEKYKDYYINGLKEIKDSLNFLKENIEICYKEEVDEFSKDDNVLTLLDSIIQKVDEDINKEYKVSDSPSEIDDLSVIVIDEDSKNRLTKFYIVCGVILAIAIIILIIGSTLKNYYLYLLLLIPLILGLGAYYYFKKMFNVKK